MQFGTGCHGIDCAVMIAKASCPVGCSCDQVRYAEQAQMFKVPATNAFALDHGRRETGQNLTYFLLHRILAEHPVA